METAKLASSVGHVYGRPVIGAESFTADEKSGAWLEEPYAQKVMGDKAFCEGINRYIFHRYAAQPWTDVKPGITMGPWGTHFDRTQTWWTEAAEWMRYVARCQYLLQSGRFVADVCYYAGEDAPSELLGRGSLKPELPAGYDYDGIDAGALLSMKVKNGRVTVPSGMSYAVLVLPESEFMTPRIARKIKELVLAGATVVGPKPKYTPSLSGFPASQTNLEVLAGQLWGSGAAETRSFGKGRVVSGVPLARTLASLGVQPDFVATSSTPGAKFSNIHRRIGDAEVYFVSNQTFRSTKANLSFRVKGRVPELWHADTGQLEVAPAYEVSGSRVSLDLDLTPAQSVFVVFRRAAPPAHLAYVGPAKGAPAGQRKLDIQIERAFYGAKDGRGADVTNKVRALVQQGESEIPATNSLFGDPTPLVVKQLTIEYSVKGVEKRIVVDENAYASLVNAAPMQSPAYSTQTRPDGSVMLSAWKAGTYYARPSGGALRPVLRTAGSRSLDLSKNWNVTFQEGRGAPPKAWFPALLSWAEHSDSGIKYFSGSAVYTKEFDLKEGNLHGIMSTRLDLGAVKNFATVWVNGQPAATLWKPPFILDVTQLVHKGKNRITVRVTNLWPNRIIGDEQLPPEVEWNGTHLAKWPDWLKLGQAKIAADRPKTGRITFATWRYFDKDSPLLPSGLIGPVKLETAATTVVSASGGIVFR
jgi:hypothetical protein